MAASTALSPVRSAGDTEGLSGEEEEPEQVIHDSHSNWLLIQDLKNKIEKMEAFEEDIQKLPLVNKELKDQKQQMEGIGDSLPLLIERVTNLEENLGGMYQKVKKLEEYMRTIEELEKQSLQNMEMQLKISTVMDKMEHDNMTLKEKIKELEDQSEKDKQQQQQQQTKENYYKDRNKEKELVNAKNSEPHKWEAGQGTFQDWRSLVEDHAERTQKGYKQTLRNIRQHKKEVTQEEWTKLSVGIEWEDKEKFHAFLKLKVSGIVRAMVEAVKEENGFEAWRIINNYCDPRSPGEAVLLEGKVLEMQNRKAKSPKEIPELLAEVDRRVTDLAEKTGKMMQQDTLKHVALAIMDPETKEKMMDHLAEDSYEELKARVFKYLVHVKGITYEQQKPWGAQLN